MSACLKIYNSFARLVPAFSITQLCKVKMTRQILDLFRRPRFLQRRQKFVSVLKSERKNEKNRVVHIPPSPIFTRRQKFVLKLILKK